MDKKMKRKPPRKGNVSKGNVKHLLAGGTMLALVAVLGDFQAMLKPHQPSNVCQQVIQARSVLSRSELAQLLKIPERDSKEAVRAVVSEPYCILPSVEIRAGATADREAYPLEFDPQTWFVVLYEGNEYAGYSFVFKR